MIEAGLFHLLSNTAAITNICGTRISPDVFDPEVVYPAMIYRVIGGRSDPTFDTSGFQRLRVEFDCRAGDVPTASALREAVRKTLEGYNGLLSDGTFLQDAQLIQPVNGYVDEPRLYVRQIDMYLFFDFSQ